MDVATTPAGEQIGMTLCPGKTQRGALSGDWARDLGTELEAIKAWEEAAWIAMPSVSHATVQPSGAKGLFPAPLSQVWLQDRWTELAQR